MRAVLFDLDGTLIDSGEDIANAVNAALGAVGLDERPLQQIRGFVGEGSRRLVEKALGSRRDLLEPAHTAWERAYSEELLRHTRLYPGIAELLSTLAPERIAVHTNKPGEFARRIVEGLGIATRFRRVLGSDDGPPRKPDPEGALFLAGILEARPSETLYVGDSAIDAETARVAGMSFVGVTWGFGSEAQLLAAGGKRFARSSDELADLVVGWLGS